MVPKKKKKILCKPNSIFRNQTHTGFAAPPFSWPPVAHHPSSRAPQPRLSLLFSPLFVLPAGGLVFSFRVDKAAPFPALPGWPGPAARPPRPYPPAAVPGGGDFPLSEGNRLPRWRLPPPPPFPARFPSLQGSKGHIPLRPPLWCFGSAPLPPTPAGADRHRAYPGRRRLLPAWGPPRRLTGPHRTTDAASRLSTAGAAAITRRPPTYLPAAAAPSPT